MLFINVDTEIGTTYKHHRDGHLEKTLHIIYWSQSNDEADTVATPYSLRPHHSPTVSPSLGWKEINDSVDPGQFTIDNITQRIEKKVGLFIGVYEVKQVIRNTRKLSLLSWV